MDCKNLDLFGSAYIDNMLSKEEEIVFKSHIDTCLACSIAFENLKLIVETTNELEEIELPINFSSQLRRKLEKEKNHRSKILLFSKNKILASIVAGLVIIVISLSLINNFSNYNRGNDLYAEMNDDIKEEEKVEINMASEESQNKTFDDVGNYSEDNIENEPMIIRRGMPGDEKDDTSQEEVKKKDDAVKEVVEEDIMGKMKKISTSFLILTLIAGTGIGFLIFKLWKNKN